MRSGEGSVAENEANRLRAAYARRGPVEARLIGNPGQAAIIRERDERVAGAVKALGDRIGSLLDIGCGDGGTVGRLSTQVHIDWAVGIDLLPERVERARQAWPGIDFRVADAAQLPFADGAFAVVLAMTALSSVLPTARGSIMSEVDRVLRPGGAFVWYDLRRPSPTNANVIPFSVTDARVLLAGWEIHAWPITLLPPIARHLGPTTRGLYPWLARIPLLLTHEIGVAIKPPAAPASDA